MKTYHGIIRHRETNGIAVRAVRRIEGGTSAVLLQSGLDEKMVEVMGREGGILWNVTVVCEMFKTYQMGKYLVKSDLENHLKDQQ